VILGALLLQVGVAPYISIAGVVPNFLLLAAVTLALVEGPSYGAASGFACGLAYDLLGTGPVGPMALVLAVTGFIAGLMEKNLFAESWLLPLTVLGVASLASEFSYGIILSVLGAGGSFLRSSLTIMLPGAVYDTVLALLVYPWLARFLRRDQPIRQFRRLA
jgi:rod shape-determining protein MreD